MPGTDPVPLVIDTDPGVDDAMALLLALCSPEADVRAVTTVYGNVELTLTAANARRLLAFAGRADIPVAAGAARPLVQRKAVRAASIHHPDGLGGRADTLPPPGPLDRRNAVELLADVLRDATRPVTLAAIGPLTNVALLLATHPELVDKIERIVVMGGALTEGNITPRAEFNVHCDPEAAHRVLAGERVPVTLVPLDLTLRCAVDGTWLTELCSTGRRCAVLHEIFQHYRAQYRRTFGDDRVAVHDSLAVLEAIVPGTLRTTPMSLHVACCPEEDRGALVTDSGETRPVDVAVDVADEAGIPGLHAEILRRLRRLDAA